VAVGARLQDPIPTGTPERTLAVAPAWRSSPGWPRLGPALPHRLAGWWRRSRRPRVPQGREMPGAGRCRGPV